MKKHLTQLFAAFSLNALLISSFSVLLHPSALHAQVPNYVPTNGLVGWWPFNGNANDESGNGNNGTVLSGVTLIQDRNGILSSAYNIDGVSCVDKRGIEIPAILNQSSNYSISCWFQIANVTQTFQTLFCSNPHNTIGVSFNHPFGQNILSSGIGDGNNWIYTGQSGNTFICNDYNTWNHLVVVKYPSEFLYFINGTLVRNQATSNTNAGVNFSLDFGTIDFSAWGCFETLNGSIDDIGIWNRALSDCEIADLYNAQVGSLATISTQTQTALDSYTWPVNGQTYTQSGQYTDTLVNAAGCDSIITLDLTLSFTGIEDLYLHGTKKLIKITDLNGKETPFRKNTVLLFIYEDGTVERVYEGE